MSNLIRNAKPLQKKSRQHAVTQTGPRTYQVCSATSGNVYNVYVDERSHIGDCTCEWGQYRRTGAGSGCSHVIAVHEFIAEQNGRRVSAWCEADAVSKQHRTQYSIGDGVIITSRKA